MIELTDTMKKKLDNPEVIKSMVNNLLIYCGNSTFLKSFDGHSPFPDFFGFGFRWASLPDNKIVLKGDLNLEDNKDMQNFLCTYDIKKVSGLFTSLKNEQIISDFFKEFYKISELSSIKVFSSEKNGDLDHIVFEFKDKISYPFKEQLKVFEKGEWQEYLAKVYLSALDDLRETNGIKNILF